MMVLAAESLDELRFPLGGEVIGDTKTHFNNVSTDTRKINKGDLFVALRGDNYDGHAFAEQAVAGGATAIVVDEELPLSVPQLLVDDTATALGRIGAMSRLNWHGDLVAITGSNGKTTVKEMIGAILKHCNKDTDVLMTEGNNNNNLGVPMTLLRLTKDHKYAVIEIGTDSPGEITYGAAMAKPSVVILNNISMAHYAGFGSRESIAREKGSLLEHLVADGLAIINGDDDFCPLWEDIAKTKGIMRILKFGYGEECDLRISNPHNIQSGVAFEILLSAKASELLQHTNTTELPQKIALQLPLLGLHNCMNAAAAFAACCSIGSAPEKVSEALADFYNHNIKGRLQYVALNNNCFILDDTYNANPASMTAALKTLDEHAEARSKVAIIGDMLELGDESLASHKQIGELAGKLGLDGVLSCGEMADEVISAYTNVKPGDVNKGDSNNLVKSFASVDEINEYLEGYINKNDIKDTAFLVKGSRGMTMEKSVDFLINELGKRS